MDEGNRRQDSGARIRELARIAREEGIASLEVSPDGAVSMTLLPAAPQAAEPADVAKLREADEARRQRLRYAHVGGA